MSAISSASISQRAPAAPPEAASSHARDSAIPEAPDTALPDSSQNVHCDTIIIGAGPSGLALANAFAREGLRVTVLEKMSAAVLADPPADGRDIALTHRSRQILRELGIWDRLPEAEIGPIREARVRHDRSPHFLQFDAARSDKSALGFLVGNHLLRRAAYEAVAGLDHIRGTGRVTIVDQANVTDVRTDAAASEVVLADGRVFSAPLTVAADSRFSESRRRMGIPAHMHDFARVVIVCRMAHARANEGVAHECFLQGGTLAVLPLNGNRCSVVITLPAYLADERMACSAAVFNEWVARQFEYRLGAMQLLGERHRYPLVAVYARYFHAHRFALLGDAAVGMHPVTAHGYNFGLYGVDALTASVRAARQRGEDIGGEAGLRRYERMHRHATLPIFLGTNALVKLYTDDRWPARVAREGLLRVADRVSPLKAWITRHLTDIPQQTVPDTRAHSRVA